MDAPEAFSLLLRIAHEELKKVQQAGATYFTKGDTTHVRQATEQLEKIQLIINSIYQLESQWDSLFPATLMKPLPPKIIKHKKIPKGLKTPQLEYWVPILQTLIELGGKGQTKIIINRVGEIMANTLNEVDWQFNPLHRAPRWKNAAEWARFDMVKGGLIKKGSPTGIWEITDEGRNYYYQNSRQLARISG